jgi:transposase-like protein
MQASIERQMDKAGKRVKLSPARRIEVWREYNKGGCSVRSLAAKYGCSKSTISNIIKGEEPTLPVAPPDPPAVKESLKKAKKKKVEPPAPPAPPAPLPSKPLCYDPLEFREQKLEEIAIDIQTSRLSGRTSIIPQLHRLHLSIHDEVVQLQEAREGTEEGLDHAALVATIVGTVSKLPPMTRQEIHEKLEDLLTGRIISFPQVTDEEAR